MIPDYFEAITAYRMWLAYPNGLMIGHAHNEPWPPYRVMQGRCGEALNVHILNGEWQDTPVLSCNCGIYAYKSEAEAEARADEAGYIAFFRDFCPPRNAVWGSVKLWGKVIEHERGYRAEFAYPYELKCRNKDIAEAVSALYGVPCIVEPRKIGWDHDGSDSILYNSKSYFLVSPSVAAAYDKTLQQARVFWTPLYPTAPLHLSQVRALQASRWQKRAQTKPKPASDWDFYRSLHTERTR